MKIRTLFLLLVLCWNCSANNSDPDVPFVNDGTPLLPAQLRDGVTRISNDSLAFVLFAPNKESVHLIGDFNDWVVSDKYKMQKSGDRFWIKIGGLSPDKEYVCQYLINKQIAIADPYAVKVSDGDNDKNISSDIYPDMIAYPVGKTTDIAMVVSTSPNSYGWKVKNFDIPAITKLTIYELLIRDFTEEGSVKAAMSKIPYLKSLGINAIELMPFNEFEGNNSWGYNPSFYFAPDKAYGTANDYKKFIDECHSNGMAVIMDIVLNHSFGQSPMVRMYQDPVSKKPTADNPWYNQTSNFENPDAQWGYDFNHDSPYTRQFVDSVCGYWMNEYKIDGFRFDFTKGFSNTYYPNSGNTTWGNPYDAARISNLKRIHNEIKKRKPDALMICEHLSDNDEEKELGEAGILLWSNVNYSVNEATMGWVAPQADGTYKSDSSWGSYLFRGWTQPNLITYMESHDEERLMFKNLAYGNTVGSYNVRNLDTALDRCEAAAVILFTQPGPKMVWQFGEVGYDYELNNDRTGKKPVRWDYYTEANRKSLFDVYAKMINLRKNNEIFATSDYTTSLARPVKQVLLKSTSGYVCAVANFDVVPQTETVLFGKSGKWVDYFSGAELTTSSDNQQIELQPGEYRLYMSK